MSLIGWVLFGLVVGVVAKLIMPGKQNLNLLLTAVLGMAGSAVGGLLGSIVSSGRPSLENGAGWIGSILGALLLLGIAAMINKAKPPRERLEKHA